MRWHKRIRCEEAGCVAEAECRGKCRRHYQQFYVQWRRECLRNGSLVETPAAVLPEPHWEFLGDEESLIQMTELQEKQKQLGEHEHEQF
jgi:hypothetical protein